jgi:hypothetical protein
MKATAEMTWKVRERHARGELHGDHKKNTTFLKNVLTIIQGGW